jgi:hypothetical protein
MKHGEAAGRDKRSPPEPDVGLPLAILRLLGDEVYILHPLASDPAELGGGDIDCAVSGLDFSWPLRLPPGYRLVQYLHYDVRAWAWVLERNGAFTMADAIDDPAGINRLGFATSSLTSGAGDLATPSIRAAYLTAKRVWKGQIEQPRWAPIHNLTVTWDQEFQSRLRRTFGHIVAAKLEASVRSGSGVDRRLWALARSAQYVRRFSSPGKAASLLYRGPARIIERVLRPTGVFILLLAGEGSDRLPASLEVCAALRGPLMRERIIRWKEPPEVPGKGTFASIAFISREWLRFLVRVCPSIWKHRVAKGLIVVERGWWQPALSHRSGPAERLATAVLSHLLPRPDLTFLVSPEPGGDDEGQQTARLAVIRRAVRIRSLHGVQAVESGDLVQTARKEALTILDSRARRRLGTGWTGFPPNGPKWIVPRRPRAAVTRALAVHQPPSGKYLPWRLAEVAAMSGLFLLLPRSQSPPEGVRALLADYLLPHGTISVARCSEPDRFIAAIIGADGVVHAVAKVATHQAGVEALSREGSYLERLGSLALDSTLRTPRVIDHAPGVLLLEPLEWRRRREPWKIPEEVAHALGRLSRMAAASSGDLGLVHGDCTYLNLRATRKGWVLLDWEDAQDSGPALHDLFHHLLVSHALLRRPSLGEIRSGLRRGGWVGEMLDAYLAGASMVVDDLDESFLSFLSPGGRCRPTEPAATSSARRRLFLELRS